MSRSRLPQLIAPRIRHLLTRVEALLWAEKSDLEVQGGPVHGSIVPVAQGQRGPWKPVAPHSNFGPVGGSWGTRWFSLSIPKASTKHRGLRHLLWDCNGETTVYIDGVPWAGLDVGHFSCPLPDGATTLLLQTGLWQTAIWAPGRKIEGAGCRFDGAWLGLRDQQAWDAYHDLEALTMVMVQLFKEIGAPINNLHGLVTIPAALPRLLRILLHGLDQAADTFDQGGLAALAPALRALITGLPAEHHQAIAGLTGHSHLDLVWLWPEAVTRSKAAHTFSTMLRLMERYPEFRFSGSQPYLYRAVAEDQPALAKQVAKRVASGQWELTGGMEVESDTLVPCGEALARSLIYGQAAFTALRGSPSTVVWIPDVFGYSACLPQLMVQTGITGFFTTKLTWSAINRFPHTSFTWRGHDGTAVLTHLCPTGYNGGSTVAELADPVAKDTQSGIHDELLLPTGYGDGAGGPNEQMCERARRLADLAGSPRARWVTIEAFFDRLRQHQHQFPQFQGELYLEYHRGTFTTQAEFKRSYRELEKALQLREAVHALCGLPPLVSSDWQRLIFAQFHDALPGSSIGLVYEQLTPELQTLAGHHRQAAHKALATRGRNKGHLVQNPLALSRRTAVRLAAAELPTTTESLMTPDGRLLPIQSVSDEFGDGYLTMVDLVALGSERLLPSDTPAPVATTWTVTADTLDNGVVSAQFAKGELVGLSIHGSPQALGGACGFTLHPDFPANFDAWDIDQQAMALGQTVAGGMKLSVIESGPVRGVLRGSAAIGAASSLEIDYILLAGLPYLQIEVRVNWQETHQLLKWNLRTAHRGARARFGAPFGSVERGQLPGLNTDEAQWEVPGSRWAAVTDGDGQRGLAVISEAKYGFHVRDGELGLSLLRSPTYPDPRADRGQHRIRFAVGEHRAVHAVDRPNTAAAAEMLFGPLAVLRGGSLQAAPLAFDSLGSLVPAWVLPVAGSDDEPALVVRLHETMGRRGEVTVVTAAADREVRLVDLRDQLTPEVSTLTQVDAHTWRLSYQPYQLLSLRLG